MYLTATCLPACGKAHDVLRAQAALAITNGGLLRSAGARGDLQIQDVQHGALGPLLGAFQTLYVARRA